MTPKQAAIKKAYGEYYDTFKDEVDENGWVVWSPYNKKHPGEYNSVYSDDDLEWKEVDGQHDSFRPKSLTGIEGNNGWISIEERLPDDCPAYQRIWVYIQGVVCQASWWNGKWWGRDRDAITHWKPILKPEAPLY